jgi:hypothetical protein
MIKNIQMPSKREALTVTVIMALFLLLTGIFIGLRSEHLLMAALYLVLFFAGLPTRKLAVALLPFAIFGISYDWMRICPNYEVNPIDVAGLYNLEKSLFGVMDNGLLVTPCEYFAAHNWPIADVFAGIFYLCWVPVPILFGLCHQLLYNLSEFLLVGKQAGSLFLQFHVTSYLHLNICPSEQESGTKSRMIRFQEAQVINPFAYSFQLSFQIDPGFLTCKKVISVTRFQIEADAFIIIVILRKIFFKRIIVPLDG